ncbi:hypothetical protein BUALT_Bualt12G0118700 [Buddleja alternifolia]|uniref:Cyclin N-terminal domain-containing protein n=1 Tax=Buddleja alternifolia TaxID=168488 RepID=A0AAV6WYL6_9LAMI|nr:hypothetical protein BUALT_Bualt12G0118700 [Buddleja alternifolia]
MSTLDHQIIDIDAVSQDRLLSPTMVKDVFQSLRSCELKKRPQIDYMEKLQKHINPKNRAYCIDFIIYVVAYQLGFHQGTMCMAVNYLDRYLSENEGDLSHPEIVSTKILLT